MPKIDAAKQAELDAAHAQAKAGVAPADGATPAPQAAHAPQ
jgi:hypothetical protein